MSESNTMETSNGTQDVNGFGRMNSTSSQRPLTTTYKQPFHTKCLSLLGLSMFECCLIISNAIFILILMPMVFKISADVNDVRHDGLQEIKDALELKLDNHTEFIILVDDILNLTQKIHHNISEITSSQQLIKENQRNFDIKISDIKCSIRANDSAGSIKSEIDLSIPTASAGEEFHYRVTCQGPCADLKIRLTAYGEDADLYASNKPITVRGQDTLAELCHSKGSSATESCTISNGRANSTLYTLVHAYKAHRIASLKFTGSNLLFVKNQTDIDPVVCQQTGLYRDIVNLKKSIEQTQQETKDAIENKLDNQASSLSKIDSLVTITNTIKDNVGSIDETYQEIRGQQGGLVERLQEILCSIGFDDSSLPENITSDMSPVITKHFPRSTKDETILYTVNCQGPCGNISVNLDVNRDADLYASKYSTIDPTDSSTAELCDASGSTGYESCDINTNESTFYTLIHSYQAHDPGRITFTATNGNPISAKNQTEAAVGSLTDESLSRRVCAKFGLYHKIENITEAIEKASSETGEDIVELCTNLSSTLHKVEELITKKANEAKFGELESGHDEIKRKQSELANKIEHIIGAISEIKTKIQTDETSTNGTPITTIKNT